MANNQLLASDDFASGSLAAGWAAYTAGGFLACQVLAGPPNFTEANTLSVEAGQIWTGLTWPVDQISEVTATVTSEAASILALFLRRQTGANSGYIVNISFGSPTIYRVDAGSATQLATTSGVTFAANDVWSFTAAGSVISLYLNYKRILYTTDATYTTGYPGCAQYCTGNLTHCKVFSWRGYSGVQQDGIWQKQGIVIPLLAADVATSGYGVFTPAAILYEGNAQILSGTVYKIWFAGGGVTAGNYANTFYAESTDGIAWSRRGAAVISTFSPQALTKNGATYMLWGQVPPGIGNSVINLYTSTDGIAWTGPTVTSLTVGAGGQWDHTGIQLTCAPVLIAGTWNALYSATLANNDWSMGLATSPDGITWTKYGSNPVLTNAIPGPLVKIGNAWYIWAATGPTAPRSGVHIDPTEGIRWKSTDLINWTNSAKSVTYAQTFECVNQVNGGCAPYWIMDVGGRTYMYMSAAPSDSIAPQDYQIELAIAPTSLVNLVTQPENALKQGATDGFTSGIGDLNANWVTPTGGVKLQIIAGNLVEATTTGAYNVMLYTPTAVANDQYSQVTLNAQTNNGNTVLIVRGATGALTYYYAQVAATGLQATGALIAKRIAGAGTQIGPSVPITPTANDVYVFSVIGNVLSLYQNGRLILQVQDTANSITSGYPGMGAFASVAVTDTKLSGWAGGAANVLPSFGSGGGGGLLTRGVG